MDSAELSSCKRNDVQNDRDGEQNAADEERDSEHHEKWTVALRLEEPCEKADGRDNHANQPQPPVLGYEFHDFSPRFS